MDVDLGQVLTGGGVLAGAAVVVVAAPRLWRPVRRLVSVVDALAGRPARYNGDKESRPGLVERLDQVDNRFDRVDAQLQDLGGRMTRLEQATTGAGGPNGAPAGRHTASARDREG